jgi:hypothetical protein
MTIILHPNGIRLRGKTSAEPPRTIQKTAGRIIHRKIVFLRLLCFFLPEKRKANPSPYDWRGFVQRIGNRKKPRVFQSHQFLALPRKYIPLNAFGIWGDYRGVRHGRLKVRTRKTAISARVVGWFGQ